jgi:hypothetical protein
MPYITQCRREDLDSGDDVMQSPGELNYRITKLIGEYLDEFNIHSMMWWVRLKAQS